MILTDKKSIYIAALISAPICGIFVELVADDILFSIWDIPAALFSLFLLFAWYRLDTNLLGLKRRIWGNSAFVYFTVIAMPVYLLKTRGWLKGIKASMIFFVVMLLWSLLEGLGALAVGLINL